MPDGDKGQWSVANRRRFLKTAGSAAIVGSVAGCLGGGGGDDGSDSGDSGGDSDSGDSGGDGGGSDGDSTEEPGSDYPSGDIDFIVPYSTGGGFDAYARLMAPYLEEELGTTVNVRNVTGGGGVVGATELSNADPDGHTLGIWAPKEAAYKQIGLDVDFDVRDWTKIGYVTQDPNELVLMESAGIDTWEQFVSSVSDLNFVTQGRGSSAHMLTILLGGMTGAFDVEAPNFVHYEGTGAALAGLESGEGDAFTVGTASSAAKVVNALEAEMFVLFESPDHSVNEYLEDQGIEVMHHSTELDIDNVVEYNELTVFRRFIAAPPGVPDDVHQQLVGAFETITSNEEFIQEAREAARPIIDPEAGEERVTEAIDSTFETLSEEPYASLIQDAFSS
ncbi:tripartite tricarboxylate transporter substrate-binding protein [Halobellus sp. GM3]|uniref:tripartite tricarboxylate transporter substrate-binding protein n=1 Tax=Halobellus sp. GM3 TaxID=3458410 RepID=UPI00403DCD25